MPLPANRLRMSMAANGLLSLGCACAALLCVLRARGHIGPQSYADGIAVQTVAMVLYQHLHGRRFETAFLIRYKPTVLPSYLGIGMLVILSQLPIRGFPRPASAFELGLAALYVLLVSQHIRAFRDASSVRKR